MLRYRIMLALMILVLAMAGAAQAATINVPEDYETIQTAINAATAGDTILVAPGNYHERLVIDKPLDIRGAQYGVNPTKAGARTNSADESVIDIADLPVTNPNVLVEIPEGVSGVSLAGFTLNGSLVSHAADECAVRCWSDNITIADNIISGYTSVLYKGPGSKFTALRNRISATKQCLVVQPSVATNILVAGNSFALASSPAADCQALYLTSVNGGLVANNVVSGFTGGRALSGSNLINLVISGNVFTDGKAGISIWGDSKFVTVHNNILSRLDGDAVAIKGQDISITANTIDNNVRGIYIAKHTLITERVRVSYNAITRNGIGVEIAPEVAAAEVDATKNWWGNPGGPWPVGGGDQVVGSADYEPWLSTPAINAAFGGNRLAQMQYTDGAWGWPLNAPPTYANIHGPIAMGLAQAYLATRDTDILDALEDAKTYLLLKTAFSPSDGYLAAQLDSIFGGTTCVDYVKTNFYNQLADGTYMRNGVQHSTESYVNLIRTNRSGNNVNLAAWDIGMGLAAAVMSGADTGPWVQATKDELNEIDPSKDYDVIGLAGGLYGLVIAGEDFDPTAGPYASASNLNDLAYILAGFQLNSGGFTRNSGAMVEDDGKEAIQETAYAALALDAVGGYGSAVAAAANYMKQVQLSTGGWANDMGGAEYNEVTGEALWAMSLVNKMYLDVDADSLFVQPGETVSVTLNQSSLADPVTGYQAFLEFAPANLEFVSGTYTATPYSMKVINPIAVSGGTMSVAAGSTTATTADATLVNFSFEAVAEGTTQVTFAAHDPATMFTDSQGNEVAPQLINSPVITIDGTPPADLTISADPADWTPANSVSFTFSATDVSSGIDHYELKIDDGAFTTQVSPYVLDVTSMADGVHTATVKAIDRAGNEATASVNFYLDKTKPVITIDSAKQNAAELIGGPNAIQGIVDIYVTATDAASGFAADPVVTVTPNGASAETATLVEQDGDVFHYTWTVDAETPNGAAVINASVTDNAGNTESAVSKSFNVNKSQAVVTVELEGVIKNVDRWITFTLGGTGGTVAPVTIKKLVSFEEGTGTVTLTDLPNNGAWTRISAKDEQHTLRRSIDLVDSRNRQFTANFTGDANLIGGDLTNDNLIDIRDFGLFAGQFGPISTATTQWPVKNADISCDGVVDSADFGYIQIHFLLSGDGQVAEASAASADVKGTGIASVTPASNDSGVALTSISVRDLARIAGMKAAINADVNQDYIVNATDVQLFIFKYMNVRRSR